MRSDIEKVYYSKSELNALEDKTLNKIYKFLFEGKGKKVSKNTMIDKIDQKQKQLEEFGKMHGTYINQIFGDRMMRKIITEEFPRQGLDLFTENPLEEYAHHVVTKNKGKTIICSVKQDIQDIDEHPNDMLCQTYSMFTYMKGENVLNKKKLTKNLQHKFIEQWKYILKNKIIKENVIEFTKQKDIPYWELKGKNEHELDEIAQEYKIKVKNGANEKQKRRVINLGLPYIWNMPNDIRKKKKVITLINNTLNNWKKYGWLYFELPCKPKITTIRRSTRRRRSTRSTRS